MKKLKVKFTFNTEYAGEGPSNTHESDLETLKMLAEVYENAAESNTKTWNEVYFAGVELLEGDKEDFIKLQNFMESL